MQISTYATALYSTWIFLEEYGILLDAGDGVSSALTQKLNKIKHIFLSHADRDHISGLPQILQLVSKVGKTNVYYPEDCGSFPALEKFLNKFDPHIQAAKWNPIKQKDNIYLNKNLFVEAVKNAHMIKDAEKEKSFGFKLYSSKKKLRSEFLGLSGLEIKKMKDEKGEEALFTKEEKNILSYSADTPVFNYDLWDQSEVLIHEATFLGINNERIPERNKNKHSNLVEVIKMVKDIKVEKLILSHFSMRYSHEQIDQAIRSLCKEHKIQIPVYRILPGKIHMDILSEEPINS